MRISCDFTPSQLFAFRDIICGSLRYQDMIAYRDGDLNDWELTFELKKDCDAYKAGGLMHISIRPCECILSYLPDTMRDTVEDLGILGEYFDKTGTLCVTPRYSDVDWWNDDVCFDDDEEFSRKVEEIFDYVESTARAFTYDFNLKE